MRKIRKSNTVRPAEAQLREAQHTCDICMASCVVEELLDVPCEIVASCQMHVAVHLSSKWDRDAIHLSWNSLACS